MEIVESLIKYNNNINIVGLIRIYVYVCILWK